jgi:ATP-dependent Clp protease ATP-binding subunit ClpA
MWEPFTASARHTIVRAQEVAQMFGSSYIGTEHITFALAERDDVVGAALAQAVDRDAIRDQLGAVSTTPVTEMVFNHGAKRSIERAFEAARRLNHSFIGTAHLALGILVSGDAPPMLAGTDAAALQATLERAADGERAVAQPPAWRQTEGEGDPHPAARSLLAAIGYYPDLHVPGARVRVTIQLPGGAEHGWSWTCAEEPPPG